MRVAAGPVLNCCPVTRTVDYGLSIETPAEISVQKIPASGLVSYLSHFSLQFL